MTSDSDLAARVVALGVGRSHQPRTPRPDKPYPVGYIPDGSNTLYTEDAFVRDPRVAMACATKLTKDVMSIVFEDGQWDVAINYNPVNGFADVQIADENWALAVTKACVTALEGK